MDSALSLMILKNKGYDLVGVFIKVYQPDASKLCWQAEKKDAEEICRFLGIPFLFVDLEKEYKEKIFDYMISAYKQGKTPNPDVFCNKYIKFGAFLDFALSKGADFVATGHYARKFYLPSKKRYFLAMGRDFQKDQSYFLSYISQKMLEKAVFPIGDFKKASVRKMAQKAGLFVAKKKDSQGLCFVGKVKMQDFLSEFIPEKPGDVLNLKGEVVGRHKGVIFYTIGQRHGFEIFPKYKSPEQKRLFVVAKDLKKNQIIISENFDKKESPLSKKYFLVKDFNWISEKPDFSKKYKVRIRHRGALSPCFLEKLENGMILVKLLKGQKAVAEGQIATFYDGILCLGGGEILHK